LKNPEREGHFENLIIDGRITPRFRKEERVQVRFEK
jgi:hypothetical protein